MDREIEKRDIDELKKLQGEITGNVRVTLANAIRAGELLTKRKNMMNHGEFIPWIEKNVPTISRQTASNYMRAYSNRAELKCKSVLHLTDAYKMLAGPKRAGTTLKLDLSQMPEPYRKPRKMTPEQFNRIASAVGVEDTKLIQDGAIDTLSINLNIGKLANDTPENIRRSVENRKASSKIKLKDILKYQKNREEKEDRMRSMHRKNAQDREYERKRKEEKEEREARQAERDKKEKETLYLHGKPPELPNLFTSMVLNIDKFCADLKYLFNQGKNLESIKYVFRDKSVILDYIKEFQKDGGKSL